jgi:hypothetical protein
MTLEDLGCMGDVRVVHAPRKLAKVKRKKKRKRKRKRQIAAPGSHNTFLTNPTLVV